MRGLSLLGAAFVALVACDESKPTPDSAVDLRVTDLAPDVAPADAPPTECLTTTKSGPVQGVLKGNVCAYLGIPYAAPPTGNLRWKPPQPPTSWTQPLVADKPGNVCPPSGSCWGTADEDCLSLNVWRPTAPPAKPRPVMVWIHQGLFNFWGSSTRWTMADKLSEEQDLVVVSFNHRLGPLGFLAHPALGAGSGNYGALDMIHALKWVRDNIAAFGGDPQSVTIVGGNQQGGASVCMLMVSKAAKGLFQRSIMHSGSCVGQFPAGYQFTGPILTRAQAEAQGVTLAEHPKIQCDTASDVAACLRGKTADQIAGALPNFAFPEKLNADALWGPITEPGGIIEDSPRALVQAGNIASPVPVLLGTNHLEYGESFYVYGLSEQDYTNRITTLFGSTNAAAVLNQYPVSDYSPLGPCNAACAAVVNLGSDANWLCGARASARALSAAGLDTYLYHLTYPNWKSITRTDGTPYDPSQGSARWSALTYLFQSETPGDGKCDVKWMFNAEEKVLSAEIRGYWGRFIRTGDPNGAGAQAWPKYNATTDQHLVLDAPLTVGSGLRKSYCDFWETIK